MKQALKNQSTKVDSQFQQIIKEAIRRRAYDLYEARGREDGHDLDDWLHAEEEITEKKAREIAA
jgi:hypothetical protein